MENIPLLLIGSAADGPVEEPVEIRSLDQAARLFGAYVYEQTTVTSGSTGYTLATLPWGNDVLPLRVDSDGLLVPRTLFEFGVAGRQLSWTAPGPSATGTVYFRVLAQPGSGDLFAGILAARAGITDGGISLHVLRLGGTQATAPGSGAASGFIWSSRYPGTRYNGLTVAISGGRVTISPSPGTGRVRVYQPASDAALNAALLDDLARGYQPLYLTGNFSSQQLTLPSGTYTLAGGTDGAVSAAGLESFLTDTDLDGVDLLCPLGLTTDLIAATQSLDLLADNRYPTLLVAQAPVAGSGLFQITNTHRYLVSVGFSALYEAGSPRERTADGAPLAAAILAGKRFGLTLAPLPTTFSPSYDTAGLHAAAAAGHLVPYQSISKGPALWQAVTGDSNWPVSTFRGLQEVARAVYERLEPLLGQSLLDLQAVRTSLGSAFTALESGIVTTWELQLQGDILYLDLEFAPFGELRTIHAQLALAAQEWPLS